MNIQYITDGRGHTNAVQLNIRDWEKIQNDLKELEWLKNKPKQKLSERFSNCISEDRAEELQEELKKMRNEWERDIC
ncbi:MAG: hypothetical protein B6D61_04970 [Bacteroidetes bacterium 4484_249]|nr:MAG: hypothetical protein B6D61_04970 [Bacteroidetes bacterium 4484_249]